MDFRDFAYLGSILVTMGVGWGAFKALVKRVEILETNRGVKEKDMNKFKDDLSNVNTNIQVNKNDISGLKSDIVSIKKDVSETRKTSIENNILLGVIAKSLGV